MNALTQQEKKLIRLLPEDGTRPISNQKLATLMDLQPRVIRALVYGLITRHGCPIGSSHDPAGYFWITSETDRAGALVPLKSQIGQMIKRISATATNALISKEQALTGPTITRKSGVEPAAGQTALF